MIINFAGFPLEVGKTYTADGITFVITKLLTGEYVAMEKHYGGSWISEKEFDSNLRIYEQGKEVLRNTK